MVKIRHGAAAFLFLALIVSVSLRLTAQSARSDIRVEQDQPVGRPTDFSLVEPHLSVDPRNPNHLVAAAMARVSPGNQNLGCVAFSSFDGGSSWTSTHLNVSGVTACADPWTAILHDGTALLSYLSNGGKEIVVLRSPNGGRTWGEPPVRLLGPHDHPMLLDTAGGVIYLVSALSIRNAQQQVRSAVYVAQSRDGGRSFSERARVVISNLSYEALTPALLSDGALVIGVIDHHDVSERPLERRRAWVVLASRTTFSEPMLVTESCSRTRFTSWPSLAVVHTQTSSDNRLVFTCEADGNRGILFAHSEDHGNRWTSAVRIDGDTDVAWTKTPTMTTSSAGVLAVTWLDRRDDSSNECWHLYGMISLDGGDTFSKPTRLSTVPSCPSFAQTGEGVLGRFPAGGEYHGLVSIGPRQFLAVWPDARDGRFQLRSVRFSVAGP
jgi:hypothetical protein